MILRSALLLASLACLAACSPPEPIRLGYIGTLSGRSADFGLSGRNGTLLAVEEINAAGGINGRPITLLYRDDEQNNSSAERAVESLAAEKVAAIIGPMVSSMAYTMAPVADRVGVLVISPTATADELVGRDDNLIRLASPTSEHAKLDAEFQFERQKRRHIAAILETGNPVYTEGYLRAFQEVFEGLGGKIVSAGRFAAGQTSDLSAIIRQALQARPDALLFVGNAVDTARLAQHARSLSADIPLIGCAWAGTEEFTQLGGKAVEGMHVGQYFDRNHPSPSYRRFAEAYSKRFREPPGFGSTAAYDAVQVFATAMRRKGERQTLKEAILTQGPFAGTQQEIAFNRFGDTRRPSQITVVRNNALVVVPWP